MSFRVCSLFAFAASMAMAASACMENTGNQVPGADNQAPMLAAKSATTDQDTPVMIDLLAGARDPDGDHLTVLSASASGHVSALAPSGTITVTPATGFVGTITVSYTVSDGIHRVNGTAQITVVGRNHPPVALGGSLPVPINTSIGLTLSGSDPDADLLTFAIVSGPAHGTITGTPPVLSYTPATGFVGFDAIAFTVSDGRLTSSPATFMLNVARVDRAPEATPQSVSATEDTSLDIALAGTDADGDTLTFAIQRSPSNGFINANGNHWTYTPFPDFHGADSFTFTAFDGQRVSAPATVDINVATVNDAPVIPDTQRNLTEDIPTTFTLPGSDVDGDALSFSIDTPPQHGTLSGDPPTLTYTPDANFNGTDSFKFVASDGVATSAKATFILQVAAVNDGPVAVDSSVTTAEDTAVTIPLQASDVDGNTLTYTILSSPSDGFLTGSGASRTYAPGANANGTRSVVFRVSDGLLTATATVTITITPVNDPPRATDDWVATDALTPLTIAVLANDSDVDGDPVSITAVGTPAHGNVNIVNDKLVYTPDAGFAGIEVFTYTISDPSSATATASVHLGVGSFPSGAPTESLVAVSAVASDIRYTPSLSADGRYIAFTTSGALVSDDTSGVDDVYVYDRGTRTVARMSVTSSGTQANGASRNARISSNGRYVVFESTSTTLVAGDTNSTTDVFRHDRQTGETVRVSLASDGSQANGPSTSPRISDDGNVIAFSSNAFNLATNDANGVADIFVRDMSTGITTRISVSTSGGECDLPSTQPSLSGDGRFVAFASAGTNLIPVDTNNASDVFVRDRVAGTTDRVSVSSTGVEANAASSGPSLSSDGRFTSFLSGASNLLPGGGTSGFPLVYVHDTQAATTTRPPAAPGPTFAQLSGDGRYFASSGTAVVSVTHRLAGTIANLDGSTTWQLPTLSSNGRYVAALGSFTGGALVVAANPL
jgi:Bacterial Ig domain/Cadherin-like domain/WD40-like Beta Propeller Repeat